MISQEKLKQEAIAGGFFIESYEKVHMLLQLLESIQAHPFLGQRLALKGGTALNLFILDLPRLSVDIDLNYIGDSDRTMMQKERPRIEQALEQVFGRLHLSVKRAPQEHAGGKWRLSYTNSMARPATVEVDINFMLRTPLWPAVYRDSHPRFNHQAKKILILDEHELAAGKLAALVARSASRDLFDARELLSHSTLDKEKLRLGFVVYGGINRKDWRTITLEQITTTSRDVDSQLVPMLRNDIRPKKENVHSWTESLIRETQDLMKVVLPLSSNEYEFLEKLNGAGDIVPELLTEEPLLQSIIRVHPGLLWKAFHVKKKFGVSSQNDEEIST